ncbi:MAG: hypothetical protein WA873_12965 [Jannaschia helgolandensis]
MQILRLFSTRSTFAWTARRSARADDMIWVPSRARAKQREGWPAGQGDVRRTREDRRQEARDSDPS